jgi:hypothetical protein
MEGVNYLRYPPPESRVSFRFGRNTDWSSDALLPGQCQELINLDINTIGRLVSRGGTRKINSSEVGVTGILDAYPFYNKDGTRDFLIHVDNDLYTLDLGTGTATAKLAGLPTSRPLRWVTWNNKAYGYGGDGIFKWDGTTASKLSGGNIPDLTCGAVNDTKMFGFAELSSDPSLLYYSNELDAETYGATDFLRLRENDGDVGKDVVSVSGGLILALKSTSAWIINGTEIYDFSKAMEADEVGLMGFTLASYEGAAIWLSNQGVCYWNPRLSRQFHIISRHGCTNEIFDNSRTVLEAAYGHFSPRTRRYYLSVHSDTAAKVYVFYFDLMYTNEQGELTVPHSTYKYHVDIGPIVTLDGKGDKGELYIGNVDNGYVYEADYVSLDEAAAISIRFDLKDDNFGRDEMKRLRIIDQRAMSDNPLTEEVIIDYHKKVISKTTTYPNFGGRFDSGQFDTATFGGRNMKVDVLKYTKAKGTTFRYRITGDVTAKTEIEHPVFRYYPNPIIRTRE